MSGGPPGREGLLARRPWIPGAALVLLVLLAYLPALSCGWIWDDDEYVTANALVRSPGGIADIWLSPRSLPQWYPVVFSGFWLEHLLWGLKPSGFHLVNVLLHGLNAWLLWKVLRRLGVPGAWLGAALFALHPVHVESVAWVTERKNVLSGAFALGSLLLLLRSEGLAEDGSPPAGRGTRSGAFLLLLLALLSKSVTATLPAVVLVLAWWKRGRLGWSDVRPLLPFLALGILLGLNTARLEREHVGAEGADWALGAADRVVLAGRLLWTYAGTLALPVDLVFIRPRWTVDASVPLQWVLPAAALAVLAALVALRGRIGRGPLAATLIFAGTLFPALGFLNVYPFRYSWAADHFQYLASAALLALAGAGLARAAARAGAWSPALVLLPLGALTAVQCGMYRDVETLWRETLRRNPGAWIAWNNLAVLELSRGRNAEAETMVRASLDLNPRNYEGWNNLGKCLTDRGDLEGAAAALRRAVEVMPEFSQAWSNLAYVTGKQGDRERSLEYYRKAVSFPRTWEGAHESLIAALEEAGRIDEAAQACVAAAERFPRDPRFPAALGGILVRRGAAAEALPVLEESALRLPASAGVHLNLGIARLQAGRPGPARESMETAVRLDPASSKARDGLASALAATGDRPGAEREWREAVRLDPADGVSRVHLADFLLKSGRAAEAEAEAAAGIAKVPGFWRLRYVHAVILASGGRMGEAAASYRETLRLLPGYTPAGADLAWILATTKDPAVRAPAEALRIAEGLAAASGRKDSGALDTLAAALAASGRFEDAVRTAEEAIRRAPDPAAAEGIKGRLALYRAGRAVEL